MRSNAPGMLSSSGLRSWISFLISCSVKREMTTSWRRPLASRGAFRAVRLELLSLRLVSTAITFCCRDQNSRLLSRRRLAASIHWMSSMKRITFFSGRASDRVWKMFSTKSSYCVENTDTSTCWWE